ncbi:hypothetical protein PIB30_066078 [Stylosanthes scabra]|uniref:Uncharacterized protein n=1 Tax=Stylosanthes scabra TaxID=79078 RepID=A0ABU6WKJ6_9FABA|nr:hypothetical protein [Stylosanthes scabra]
MPPSSFSVAPPPLTPPPKVFHRCSRNSSFSESAVARARKLGITAAPHTTLAAPRITALLLRRAAPSSLLLNRLQALGQAFRTD